MALMQDVLLNSVMWNQYVKGVEILFSSFNLKFCLSGLYIHPMKLLWTSECNTNMSAKKFSSVGDINYVHQMVLYTLLYSTDIAMNVLTFLTGYVKNGQNVF